MTVISSKLAGCDDVNADEQRDGYDHCYGHLGGDDGCRCNDRGMGDASQLVRRHDGHHNGRNSLDRSHKHRAHTDHLLFAQSQGKLDEWRGTVGSVIYKKQLVVFLNL